MLTFQNFRIRNRESGTAYVTAECVEWPGNEAYALVPFKPSEPDAQIVSRAAERLASPEMQSQMVNSSRSRAA